MDALAHQIGGGGHLAARRAREREVETLLETSLALVGQLELPDLLREIAERLTKLMDCHFCAVSSYDESTQTVVMLADFDAGGHRLPGTEAYSLSRFPLTRRVLEEQAPAVVNVGDPGADQREVAELAREADKSLLLVPLVFRGRSIGLIELVDHDRERRHSPQDLRLCTAVAGQAAAALHNAHLFRKAGAATRELERLGEELDRMGESFGELREAPGLEELLAAAARAACTLFEGTSCVASARGASAGYATPPAAAAERGAALDAASGAERVERRRLESLAGAEVLTATSDGVEPVSLTLSLPRAARQGEGQLLGLLAAAAEVCLRRPA